MLRSLESRAVAELRLVRSMRVVLICVFMLLLGIQVARSDDAEALPQKINIAFTAEDGATFTLKGVNVTGLTVQLAQTTYTVPADDCAKLHDVDFRTVRLLWDVESKRAVDGEYSALRFTMGTDRDRSFGELPTVHVHLDRGGKYLSTVITRKTGPTGYRDGDR
jgi:hypothetical protein